MIILIMHLQQIINNNLTLIKMKNLCLINVAFIAILFLFISCEEEEAAKPNYEFVEKMIKMKPLIWAQYVNSIPEDRTTPEQALEYAIEETTGDDWANFAIESYNIYRKLIPNGVHL